MTITPKSLWNEGLMVGPPDVAPAMTFVQASRHYKINAGQTHAVQLSPGQFPNTRKLKIIGGGDTVYLPYFQDAAASVELPNAGPTFFVTDNMSGCRFVLAQKLNGSLVVLHLNSQLKSGKTDMEGKAANYQHGDTKSALNSYQTTSVPEAGGAQVLLTVSKTDYLSDIAAFSAFKSKQEWLGGTTFVGFRDATGWSFYYQVWGSLGGSAVQVWQVRKVWPQG